MIIRLLLMIAFCAFAILYGWNLMLHQAKIGQTSPSLKLPMWFMYSCVPLGCFLLLIHYAALAWVQLANISRKIKEGGQ